MSHNGESPLSLEFLVRDKGSIDEKGAMIKPYLSHIFWIYVAHELFLSYIILLL